MAFNPINISRTSFQTIPGLPVLYAYNSGNDTIADILVSGYFRNDEFFSSYSYYLAAGDQIYCDCADGTINVIVLTISPQITTTVVLAPNNSVSTNALQFGSVNSYALNTNCIQYVKIPLTSGQFNNMFTSPIELVSPAGAHTIVVPLEFYLEVIFGGQIVVGGGTIGLQWGSQAALGGVVCTNLITQATAVGWTANAFNVCLGATSNGSAANVVNTGIYMSNATENFFLGNSTYNAYVKYFVISGTTI
jgi:hypothetical protein